MQQTPPDVVPPPLRTSVTRWLASAVASATAAATSCRGSQIHAICYWQADVDASGSAAELEAKRVHRASRRRVGGAVALWHLSDNNVQRALCPFVAVLGSPCMLVRRCVGRHVRFVIAPRSPTLPPPASPSVVVMSFPAASSRARISRWSEAATGLAPVRDIHAHRVHIGMYAHSQRWGFRLACLHDLSRIGISRGCVSPSAHLPRVVRPPCFWGIPPVRPSVRPSVHLSLALCPLPRLVFSASHVNITLSLQCSSDQSRRRCCHYSIRCSYSLFTPLR